MKPERVQQRLRELPGWQVDDGTTVLTKDFRFPAANDSTAFVGRLAGLAGFDELPRLEIDLRDEHLDLRLMALPGKDLGENAFDFAGFIDSVA